MKDERLYLRKLKGGALIYVLLLGLALFIFVTALLYRLTFTLRCVTHDESYLRSRLLADSGIHLAISLMKTDYDDWENRIRPVLPLKSDKFASANYSPELLGGRFEVTETIIPTAYPPDAEGSYVTLVSTGYSGARIARAIVTLRTTNPLTNFLMFSRGNLDINGWCDPVIEGPILVNANGDDGNFSIWHDCLGYSHLQGKEVLCSTNPTLNCDIKASGKIYLRNRNSISETWTRDPIYFYGKTGAGDINLQDIPGYTTQGKLTIKEELNAQPDMESKIKIPTTQELLEGYRNKSDKIVIDVGDCADGVLAEFADGNLYVSRAGKKTVGRVFDKDIYNQYCDKLIADGEKIYRTSDIKQVDHINRVSVTWDDPDYPNASYPTDLQNDLDGDGRIETSGDFIEVKRVIRGSQISVIPLDRTNPKVVYLRTNRTDYVREYGTRAPVLYVRGNVKGKIVLVYDVADDSLDANYDKIHTVILGDHEAPDDSPGNRIGLPGTPGVPGGIRYDDPNIKLSRTQTATSQDCLLMVSRGTMTFGGNTGVLEKRVRDTTGAIMDYEQKLVSLADQYKTYYSGKYAPSELDFRSGNWWGDHTLPTTYGIYVANKINKCDNRLSNELEIASVNQRKYWSGWFLPSWCDFETPPEGINPDHIALFPMYFRSSCVMSGSSNNLKGSMSSLGSSLFKGDFGITNYDYGLRDLPSKVLQQMGLPLTVVICSWQRF